MMTDVMISEGGMGNHPCGAWALKTAAQIFDIRETPADKQLAALSVQHKIAEALATHFEHAMAREAFELQSYEDHCKSPIESYIIARDAARDAQEAAAGSPWCDMLSNPEWLSAAIVAIAHMLASAQHIERLLYADSNPHNAAASAYKSNHVGV